MFISPWFAVAGLVLAAGPFLIHLLNRQRFRTVPWAAMDFLRHAVRRSRRMMRLQDLLLLALRTLVVILFGLAMARPYLQGSSEIVQPDQPVHAVLLVDNSLSMSFQQINGPLLTEAKHRAEELINRLPSGSRISVLPLCGSSQEFNRGAYSTPEDAIEALQAIEPVDRAATASGAIDLAAETCTSVLSPPSKQIFLISDQQATNWPKQSLETQLKKLPGPLQVVQVAAKEEMGNAWIEEFRLQDGIADLGTPAVFLATVRFEGAAPKRDVQVTLTIDGVPFSTQTVNLEPGQAREVRFPSYQFDAQVQPGQVAYIPAKASLPETLDKLPADNERFLAVPVVAALPVVFADQYGPDESAQRNRFGETFRLRRLLAPITERSQGDKQLIQVRHVRIDRLDRELLKDARLVVIAGVTKPQAEIRVLREYIEQGGSVVLAAGGEFDPSAWTQSAWEDGMGILPAPLNPTPVGSLPGPGSTLKPFFLDASSLVHPYFVLEQVSQDDLRDLYRLPFFFKAVEVDMSPQVHDTVVAAAAKKITADREKLDDLEKKLADLTAVEAKGTASEADRTERTKLQQQRDELDPIWLQWAAAQQRPADEKETPEERAEHTRPRVLGTFTNRVPFMVQREIGRGRVLFISTGVFREWNTFTSTNAIVLFDRIFHDLLERTLPRRNLTSTERLVLPVPHDLHDAQFTLVRPDGQEDLLTAGAVGANRYGVVLDGLAQRGVYRLKMSTGKDAPQVADASLAETTLSVNGPGEESELKDLSEPDLRERMGAADYRWVAQGEQIQLAGGPIMGQDLWKWLMLAVLAGLLLELAMLAWPLLARERTS